MVVPSHAGILLPLGAVTPNQAALTLAFVGAGGPTSFGATAVETSPAATAQTLPGSSLSYSAANPADATTITLTLLNRVQQQGGDYFEVTLAGFQRDGGTDDALEAPQLTVHAALGQPMGSWYMVAQCSWDDATKVLKLKANAAIPAYTAQSFSVLAPAAITLPAESLVPDQPALTIRFVDEANEDNSIAAHGIAQSPARGLHATSLAFGATAVGGAATAVCCVVCEHRGHGLRGPRAREA